MKLLLLVFLFTVTTVSASQEERIYSPHLMENANNGVLINTLMPNNNVVSGMILPSSSSSFYPYGQMSQNIDTVLPIISQPSYVSSMPPKIVAPIITNTNHYGQVGISPCMSSNIISGISQECGSSTIQRVPMQKMKQVPVKTMRSYPMVTNTVSVTPETQTDVVCPIGSQLNGNICEEITAEINCPRNFVWNGIRCTAITKSCPFNYELKNDKCIPRFFCPIHYILKDNVCHPPERPTPQCSQNFHWNGKICEIAQTMCEYGVLKDGKCEKESYDCPTGFNKIGIQCIKRVSKLKAKHILK